jgi:outer membrane receptor for ferrienterochelin and colicins
MLIRLFFIFILSQNLISQVPFVKGTVFSKGQPLEGASVIVTGSNKGTITDASGIFNLDISGIKNPRIIISYLGYKSFIKKLNFKKLNLGNIILKLDDQLDEVVISGTLKPVSRLDSPVPVEVYSQTFFKSNPTPSVFEALEIVNGVRPQLNCNVCSTGDIHINGQEGSYTMILIDGLPIVSGLSTVYGLSGIPQALIDRVEIVKGPASTLYGSEAIGGVINLITKVPENTSKISFDSFVSGWGESNTDLGYRYNISDNSTGLLGINYYNFSNPIDNNEDGFTDLTLQDRISIFNKFRIGKKLSFASRYVYEDRWGGQTNWSKKNRGGNEVYGESIYTSRFELFGNYKFNSELSFQFSFNDHSQNSVYGSTIFNANQAITFGQFIWNKSLKQNDFLLGLAYRHTRYKDDTTAFFNENIHLPGIFIQDEFKINEQNTLLLGLRYDYNSIHGSILTPRLNYKLSNLERSSTLRFSLGSGYRVAQVFTEDHAALTGARDIVFLDDLDPERSWNANINYVKKIYLKQGHILDFDASIFRTIFSNKIVPDYDFNPNQIIYDNLNGKSITQGASLNLNILFLNNLRINLGATYIDSFIKKDGLSVIPYLTERFQGVWKIQKNIYSSNLIIDVTGSVIGPMKLPLLGELDPRDSFSPTFNIINIQLTKIWKNSYEFYGGIKNLLDFTPAKNSIARSFDPFDKNVLFNQNGQAVSTESNPYALTFDPTYVFASNQGIRLFLGFRWKLD